MPYTQSSLGHLLAQQGPDFTRLNYTVARIPVRVPYTIRAPRRSNYRVYHSSRYLRRFLSAFREEGVTLLSTQTYVPDVTRSAIVGLAGTPSAFYAFPTFWANRLPAICDWDADGFDSMTEMMDNAETGASFGPEERRTAIPAASLSGLYLDQNAWVNDWYCASSRSYREGWLVAYRRYHMTPVLREAQSTATQFRELVPHAFGGGGDLSDVADGAKALSRHSISPHRHPEKLYLDRRFTDVLATTAAELNQVYDFYLFDPIVSIVSVIHRPTLQLVALLAPYLGFGY